MKTKRPPIDGIRGSISRSPTRDARIAPDQIAAKAVRPTKAPSTGDRADAATTAINPMIRVKAKPNGDCLRRPARENLLDGIGLNLDRWDERIGCRFAQSAKLRRRPADQYNSSRKPRPLLASLLTMSTAEIVRASRLRISAPASRNRPSPGSGTSRSPTMIRCGFGIDGIGRRPLKQPDRFQRQARSRRFAGADKKRHAPDLAICVSRQRKRAKPFRRLDKRRYRPDAAGHAPEAIEHDRVTRENRHARHGIGLVGIENKSEHHRNALHRRSEMLVTIGKTAGESADILIAGKRAELSRQRGRRAGIRLRKEDIDPNDGRLAAGHRFDQARHRLARPRPRPQNVKRAPVDIDNNDRNSRLQSPAASTGGSAGRPQAPRRMPVREIRSAIPSASTIRRRETARAQEVRQSGPSGSCRAG